MSGAHFTVGQAAGAGAGALDTARIDLWQGRALQLVGDNSDGQSDPQWTILSWPEGSARAQPSAAATFSASYTPDVPGSYLLEFLVGDGLGANAVRRVLRVTKDTNGLIIDDGVTSPAFGERVGDDNAAGNDRGWAKNYEVSQATQVPNVTNFAALRARRVSKHRRCQLLGHTTAGDGGEGPFRWDASSTAPDDGGTVGQPGFDTAAALATGRWIREFSGPVDAAWFGVVASTTGSPVDVAPAMQAAIDATPIGGTLHVRSVDASDAGGLRYRLKSANASHVSEGDYALVVRKAIRIIGDTAYYNSALGGGAVFTCDSGLGGVFIQGAGGGEDGRYSTLQDIAFFGPGAAVGDRAHGIYAEGSVRIIRCSSFLFRGCGAFINGDGGGHNANRTAVDGLIVDNNGEHGWYITGQESNGCNFTGIHANENKGVGIWDSSFLGNNYSGCQVALNGTDVIGQGPEGQPLGYKTDGLENASVFTGCYTEDSDWHFFDGSTIWIGSRTGAGPVPDGAGAHYLTHQTSFGWNFRSWDPAVGAGLYTMSATLAPADASRSVLAWNSENDGTARNIFRLGMPDTVIGQAGYEGYYIYASGSTDYAPIGFTGENFYRGFGRAIFLNGFVQRDFTGSNESKLVFAAQYAPPVSPGGGSLELGDRFEYVEPAAGSPHRAVLTRLGNWYPPAARNIAYTLGQRVTSPVDNGHFYQCTTAGTTHATVFPTYNTGGGSTTTDGTAVFTEWGTAALWPGVGPVGADDLTMLSRDVSAGGTIVLSDAESAHARIKFTGAPGGALSVIVSTGPCIGWVRTFWNACGQTVTVKGSGGDTGVAVANGETVAIFSDGTNCRASAGTAGPTGPTGPAGSIERRKDGISGATSYGFAGSSPDITLTANHTVISMSASGGVTGVTFKRAGGINGSIVEVALYTSDESSVVFFDETRGSLGTLGVTGNNDIVTPYYASFVFLDSTDGWVPLNPGALDT